MSNDSGAILALLGLLFWIHGEFWFPLQFKDGRFSKEIVEIVYPLKMSDQFPNINFYWVTLNQIPQAMLIGQKTWMQVLPHMATVKT